MRLSLLGSMMAEAAPVIPLHRRQSLGLLFSNQNVAYESVLSFIFGTLGVKSETVVGIQFVRVNKIIIKFAAETPFRMFLEKYEGWDASVPASLGGGTVKIINLSTTATLVTVKNAPFEMENEAITNALRRYGRVSSIKKHIHTHERAQGIQTGTRTVKMEVKHKIPATITVSGFTLTVIYSSQARACFRCGAGDHFTHDCGSFRLRGKSRFYNVSFNQVPDNYEVPPAVAIHSK